MVWFFLAGFISGAVGMCRFAHWYVNRNERVMEHEKSEDNNADTASDGNSSQRNGGNPD